MGKIAFIYPGQGAQKIGMGKDFYETKPNARRIFDEADKVLDFDIKNICFEENELINNTKYYSFLLPLSSQIVRNPD